MRTLKGNSNFYTYEFTDILTQNLIRRFEYGLVEAGAYTNVTLTGSTSGFANLQRTIDDSYGGVGRVYEGFGMSWVWETDYDVPSGYTTPIVASGVYVNNVFFPTATTSGTYAHKIEFRHGRVTFDTAIPAASGVKCEYSFRDVDVLSTDDKRWKTVVQEYDKLYEHIGPTQPSGLASILKENRVWLPSIFIDVSNNTLKPLQLGGGEIANCTVRYTCLAEKGFVRNRLVDTINNQYSTVISLFDSNKVPRSYNYDGSLYPSGVSYPTASNRYGPYFWSFCLIEQTHVNKINPMIDIYAGEVVQNMSVSRHGNTY